MPGANIRAQPMSKLKLLSALLFPGILFLACCSSYQANNASSSTPAGTPNQSPAISDNMTTDVDLCELLQSPEKYERNNVRIKGYFCDCFENATLYPANCAVQKKIWVQGSLARCKNARHIDAFRSAAKDPGENTFGGWTFGVIAQGRLTGTKGGYGHMNQFDLQFDVDCLEYAELLDRNGKRPSEMTKDQQRKVEEFERLK